MPSSLQSRKRQLVQDAIWDAAIDLFDRQGYDETTVEEIVAAAGVSPRSFFRYFASKSDLMARGVLEYGAAIVAAIDACPPSWPLARVFRHTVLDVARSTAARPHSRKTIAVGTKHPAARAAEIARLPEVQERIARHYARRRGAGDDLTPALLAGLTVHVIGVALLAWFARPGQDIDKTTRRALDALARVSDVGSRALGTGAGTR
jgi:AcrR family transcriptional regulator